MNDTNPEPPVAFEPPSKPLRKLHWPWFTLALLLPAILTFATAATGAEEAPVVCAFVGAAISGLVCGILLGRRLGRTTVAAILLSVLFIGLFAVASFALCFGGCMAGSNEINL